MTMHNDIPILLDTDIGSDIDDAVALAYLLRQPRCQLLGITTVTGDVAKRAACAQVVCQAAGRHEVPIHCGASNVLLTGPGQPHVPQYAAIERLPHRRDWPCGTAIEFLRQTIRRRPGEVTLLSIGPLTNVALLFAIDPEIPGMLKQLVSMAGVFFAGPDKREWNCLVDPIATAMVYATQVPRHISIGLDVTMQCQLPAADVRERFTGSPLDVVRQMAEVWFQRSEKLTFHDPLAAAILFKPEICRYVDGQVTVPLDSEPNLQGRTLFAPAADGAGRHRIAQAVDAPAFFDEYFSVFP